LITAGGRKARREEPVKAVRCVDTKTRSRGCTTAAEGCWVGRLLSSVVAVALSPSLTHGPLCSTTRRPRHQVFCWAVMSCRAGPRPFCRSQPDAQARAIRCAAIRIDRACGSGVGFAACGRSGYCRRHFCIPAERHPESSRRALAVAAHRVPWSTGPGCWRCAGYRLPRRRDCTRSPGCRGSREHGCVCVGDNVLRTPHRVLMISRRG